MALGGGSFLTQNKVIPGSYINFVSAAKASAQLSDRGIVCLPLETGWGKDGFTEVSAGDFLSDSMVLFGYDYLHDKMKPLREVFKNAKTAFVYRLCGGSKAENDYARARYAGERGNDILIKIEEDGELFNVGVYIDGLQVDSQSVSGAAELKDNDYVLWKDGITLSADAGAYLAGGVTNEADNVRFQAFLDESEAFSFNTLICPSDDDGIKALFAAHTKNMRDNCGVKFQTVMFDTDENYEGIINVVNTVKDEGAAAAALVYWVGGAEAGCEINRSITNKLYDGEYDIDAAYKQSELEKGINEGRFMFHRVGSDIRVLTDINCFTEFTADKGKDFASNQVIRVLDQTGNDIAVLFNTKYLGKVQNNNAGRLSFWNDIVTYNKKLEALTAIEDFDSKDVTVIAGDDKTSVIVNNSITPAAAMEKLYMTVIVQ